MTKSKALKQMFFYLFLQVQTKLTPCYHSMDVYCVCGIAVRAAGDVFVINRCSGNRNMFAFRSCIDNILEVKKIDEMNYKVTISQFLNHAYSH